MACQYVIEYVRELENKFDFLERIVLEKLLSRNLKKDDVLCEFQKLPFSLQQKYGYLLEDHEDILTNSATVKEFLIKISSEINFMNSRTLIEHLLEMYADNIEIKYMKSFFKDLQKCLSCISVPEFENSWVSLVPKNFVTITLELDPVWQHKSMEDLMKFQRHFPFRNWYLMKVVQVMDSLRVMYSVHRRTRLYRVEQCVMKSHGIVRILGGEDLIAHCSVSCH